MIIPTLGCPSKCKYCWSSEEGSPVMTTATVQEIVEWLKGWEKDRVTFTFHGGEPLLAGADFYRQALPMLADGLARMHPEFAMQTNLWRMTPEIADVLAAYHVPIGSSIDGPEAITDSQRGDGYFQKCMRGYGIAKAHGLDVRFICTFTNRSVKKKEEIFRFFLEKDFTLKLHPALPSLRSENPKEWALEPAEYRRPLSVSPRPGARPHGRDRGDEHHRPLPVRVHPAGERLHVRGLHGEHVCGRAGREHLPLLPVRGDAGVRDGERGGPPVDRRP